MTLETDMPKNTAPIPGQSLTRELGNAPYERPPELSNPEQVLRGYINYLNDPKVLEGAMGLLEIGYDVKTLVEGILRTGVIEGVHTIDISLVLLKPVSQFIINIAESTGIDYKTGDIEIDNKDMSIFNLKKELDDESQVDPMEDIEKEEPIRNGLMTRG